MDVVALKVQDRQLREEWAVALAGKHLFDVIIPKISLKEKKRIQKLGPQRGKDSKLIHSKRNGF